MSFPWWFRAEPLEQRAKYAKLSLELRPYFERMVGNSVCIARLYLIFQV